MKTIAVVGGGWAGIAAAVQAADDGHRVTLCEMAPHLGGRARSLTTGEIRLDNGQHILIGAYTETLALMGRLGVEPEQVLLRMPLALRYPDGSGLALPGGPPLLSFLRGVAWRAGWSWRERLALLREAASWAATGFRCDPARTVADLCARLPRPVQQELIEPLCVAALNTPAAQASASVFLRVLHDALFSGAGSADLLLPRRGLDALLPVPALRWLALNQIALRLGRRATELRPEGAGWRLDGEPFDAIVLACSAAEAARLAAPIAPDWSTQAAALDYEPIITLYLRCPGARLPLPMMALREGPDAPAQFVFDLGAIGGAAGVFALVVSGARDWVRAGLDATGRAALAQVVAAFPAGTWPTAPTLLRVLAEKRATFRCTPGLRRPPAAIAPGMAAAGDYIQGPYPATLEGAVRSGRQAADLLG